MPKVTERQLFKSKVHIVGVSGAEGAAAALWLIRAGNEQVVGHDFKTKDEFADNFASYHADLAKAEQAKLVREIKSGLHKLHLRDTYLAGLSEADFVVVPSAWFRYAPNKPKLSQFVRKNSSKVLTMYTLLLELYSGQTIGVTGTAGKGTTVRMLASMLPKAATFGAAWQHIDLAKILAHGKKHGTLVMEVNNRQLTLAPYRKVSPSIAAVTNITVNHLDDHAGSFAEYRKAKSQLLAYQKRSDVAILNAENPSCRLLARRAKSKVRLFSVVPRADVDATIREGWFSIRRGRSWQRIASLSSVPPLLRSSAALQSDALAALLAADAAGAPVKAMARALWNFKTQEGRLSIVRKQGTATYVNDTASTRPEATAAAVAAFPGSAIHLILGGSRQHPQARQYEELFKILARHNVQTVALIGSLASWLAKRAKAAGLASTVHIAEVKNLAAAAKLCTTRAKLAKGAQVVLLSPGCESFGEFKDYRERGEKFYESIASS
jgi:UDP-N-acetylmuramoylalanine--D-glutamate ligase